MRKSLALAPPFVACAIAAAGLSLFAARAGAATIAAMRDQRRVVIVAAPSATDPQLAAQRRALAGWRQGALDRDISVVEVVGNSVSGADDTAGAIERRYALPAGRFAVVLIGKDGHVAMRSATPLSAATLEGTIDAMPMRRAGER
ncbi:MAG: DUF4174 domain-containing protein [Janthinobacterium lividum]